MQLIKFTYLTFALLFIVSLGGKAQSYTISGIVVDANDNQPLIGAYISSTSLNGKSNISSAAVAGIDGKFTLNVSGRQKLSVAYIGCKTAFITLEICRDCHAIVRMVTDERKNKNKKSEFEFYPSEEDINKTKTEHSDSKVLLEKGNNYVIKKDYTKAVKWYQKAAEQGDATAQNNLGVCYYYGQGVEKDYAQAVKWYQKAAEQGFASAQTCLGYCYEYGEGVEKDYAQAVKWYQKAAEQGFARAQNNLGVCYANGRGVEKDYAQAVKWYQKAAEQGDATAQNNLGVCYYYGQGVEKDYAQAVKWYQKAAEQGFANAQNNLGVCYYYGQGVEKDYAQAVKWCQKAAEQGDATAQYFLARIQKNSATQTTTSENTTTNIVQSNINKTSQISKKTIETSPSQKRMALIVGNSDYESGRLINPANDAADLTEKFESLGFETIGRTNKDKRELKDEISNFCIKAKNYDAAIFYYAGHAIQNKGINYLVPIDATINSPADIEYECIDMNWVLRSMEEAGIKTKIIILDACRNNPVAQSWERSLTTSGLTNMPGVPVGTYLVFATQAGKVAKDGVGQRNSPYTKALLEMLDVPGLPVHELFHEVKKLVAKQTNQEQIPSETNNLLGDFIINAQ